MIDILNIPNEITLRWIPQGLHWSDEYLRGFTDDKSTFAEVMA